MTYYHNNTSLNHNNHSSKTLFLIGAGLHNAVLAREMANIGFNVKIYEQRSHIGGNCFDTTDKKTGILYHAYGPHIFHFSNIELLQWLSNFDEMIPFHHSVKSLYKGKLYPIPINLDTINLFFGCDLRPSEVDSFLKSQRINSITPNNMEEKCISLIGKELYEAFFKEYTLKQWGKDPRDLPPSTIERIPVRKNYNSSYYNKPFSYLPQHGFTFLIQNILNHPQIEINLNSKIELNELKQFSKSGIVVYTGALDELFNQSFGKLEYRSLRFEKEYLPLEDFQGISVTNYPELKYEWTRITEPKHFTHKQNKLLNTDYTLIIKEFSYEHHSGQDPYYPINNNQNAILSKRYRDELNRIGNIIPAGRLGSYCYTDMENTINNALNLCKKIKKHYQFK